MFALVVVVVVLLAACGVSAVAATSNYSGSYYAGIDWDQRGPALRKQLGALLLKHHQLSYTQVWDAFWKLDAGAEECSADQLFGLYSASCWEHGQQCGNYKKEGECYNREHSWPKSWWGGTQSGGKGAYTDVLLLFPADGYVNNRRGNVPFCTIVGTPTYVSSSGAKVGDCDPSGGYTGKGFEPAERNKGVLARAQLYVSTAYVGQWACCDTPSTSGSDLKPWSLRLLLDWHKNYPVTEAERVRNNATEQVQGNRNPFIDFPSQAERVFAL